MNDIPAPPATLKDQLAILIAAHEAKDDERPGSLNGWDWFQLSNAEEAVFQIDRDRFPRLVMTWYCYEAFKLVQDSPEWDDALIRQERQRRPGWCGQAWLPISTRQLTWFRAWLSLSVTPSDCTLRKN